MPGIKPKELHVAKSIKDLNKFTEFKISSDKNKLLHSAADKVYSQGEEYYKLGDEEKAYIQFMRYFEIIKKIKKSSEYQDNRRYWDDLLGSKKSEKAIERAEKLYKSLEHRYELKREEEEVRQKLEHLDRLEKELENEKKTEVVKDNAVNVIQDGIISPLQLYTLMKDGETSILLIDIRSKVDFQHSHLIHKFCINIPAEILRPGIIVTHLEKDIPLESTEVWNMRGRVDYVVLFDWHSSLQDVIVGSKLLVLREALVRWDPHVVLRSQPLVLQGGYENWLLHYPMLTTNSTVIVPTKAEVSSNSISLDFDYPNFEDALVPQVSLAKREETYHSDTLLNVHGTDISSKKSIPLIDRSSKPKELMENNKSEHALGQLSGEHLVIGDTPVRQGNVKESRSQVQREIAENLAKEDHLAQERIFLQQEQLDKEIEFEKLRLRKEREIETSQLQEVQKREEMLCEWLQKLQEQQQIKDEEANHLRSENERMRQQLEDHMNKESRRQIEEETARIKKKEEEKKHLETQVIRLRKERKRREELEKKKLEEETVHFQKEIVKKDLLDKQVDGEQARSSSSTGKEEMDDTSSLSNQITKSSTESLSQTFSDSLSIKTSSFNNSLSISASAAADKHGFRNQHPNHRICLKTPGLPPGWEKVLDPHTGCYFYVNSFTKKEQWQPPPMMSIQPNQEKEEIINSYTVKLKDKADAVAKKSALTRSHSSPNIAQMVNLEAEKSIRPHVNRLNKPAASIEMPSVNRNIKPQLQEINAARLRNLMPVFGNQSPGLTGLRNLGNTCFMSSVIQSLCNTIPLSEYFGNNTYQYHINRENKLGHNGEVAEEFAVIIRAVWSGQYRSISPRDFKNTISKYAPMFSGYEQQDSQEFLLFLMDGLHEDLNRIKNRPIVPEQDNDNVPDYVAAERAWNLHKLLNESIIVELFQGQFKSSLRCLKCGKTSVTFDAFMYLSLPIPINAHRSSLTDCIHLFLKEEMMTGGSKWYCPRCKEHREAVKKFDIWKLPPILLIHLKRFSYEGLWRRKLQTYVDFPLTTLNMQSHIIGPAANCLYNLYAVSNHYGTMEGGHYTAYCKNSALQKWFKFDDHEVFEMNVGDVKSSAAYILLYTNIPFGSPVMHNFQNSENFYRK